MIAAPHAHFLGPAFRYVEVGLKWPYSWSAESILVCKYLGVDHVITQIQSILTFNKMFACATFI